MFANAGLTTLYQKITITMFENNLCNNSYICAEDIYSKSICIVHVHVWEWDYALEYMYLFMYFETFKLHKGHNTKLILLLYLLHIATNIYIYCYKDYFLTW